MKPYLVALLVNTIYAGMIIFSKAAFNQGLSTFVFIFYRQLTASLLLVPLAFIFERKKAPPVSFMILLKLFFLSLIGITGSLNIYNVGLKYTSSIVVSAINNSIPVITFFIAFALRLEKIKLKTLPGTTKLIGVILCLVGVVTVAFYTGPRFSLKILHLYLHVHHSSSPETHVNWIEGTFLILIANITWSVWLILQGKMLVEYPSKLLMTALQCTFSAVTCFCISIGVERDFTKWRLGWDIGLVAVLYCGFVVTGVAYYLQAWCIEKKGAVFMAMATPFCFVITTILSAVLLGEMTSLGSILGGLLMVGGLYSVLWGKSKEQSQAQATLPVEVGKAKDCVEEDMMASPFHP